jgi:tetratricopeptide (TPR) repeat protein
VVAAHLAAAPKADPVRLGGLAPFAALVAALAVAGVLVLEGWRWARAYALESAASEIVAGREDLDEQYLGLLEEASRTLPERAELHLKAGQAYLEVYERRLASLKHREAVGMAAAAAFAAVAGPGEPLGRVGFACLAPVDGGPDAAGGRAVLARRFLVPGLRHHLQARDLCPLIAKAHLRIAASAEWLKRADPREAYLQRAKRAYPVSPEVWYLAGNLELSDLHEQAAWASWRRSLALSPQFLDPIVKRAGEVLAPDRLIEHVLPDDPGTLMAAADRLYPRADDEGREPFLRRALICLQRREEEPTAPELYLKAQLQVALGEEQGALTSYADALLRDPGQVGWRFAYAELLRKRGRLKEARQELRYVLAKDPTHAGATVLMQRVAQDLAEGD